LRIPLQEKGDEFFAKFLHAFRCGASSQGIDSIFHCIRREDLAVISIDKAGREVSLKQNLNGPVADLVVTGMPLHSYNADARFTVAVLA
jgi:hypothetical protein